MYHSRYVVVRIHNYTASRTDWMDSISTTEGYFLGMWRCKSTKKDFVLWHGSIIRTEKTHRDLLYICQKFTEAKKHTSISQTCLGQNVSIWSQFETFLTFEIQLRLSLFESNLRHFSALSKKCQKGLKNVSKRDLGGFSGWTVFSGT